MRWEQMSLTEQTLRDKSLIKAKCVFPCAVCNTPTSYIDFCSEQRICSEECMHILNDTISKAGVKFSE